MPYIVFCYLYCICPEFVIVWDQEGDERGREGAWSEWVPVVSVLSVCFCLLFTFLDVKKRFAILDMWKQVY